MSASLAVVGTGQLGRRHLEALARLSGPARVWAWDPFPAALGEARKAWDAAAPGPGLSADFSGRFPEKLDAVIVATDAASREAAVGKLLDASAVRFLVLEKVLFQEASALDRVGARLAKAGTKAWVNCPRRMWPLYKDRRVKGPLSLKVTGAGWGLATNAVHYLDLAAHLTGFSGFSVDLSGLTKEAESKRPGFVEFFGTLRASGGGHSVSLSCEDGPKASRVEINGEAVDEKGSPLQSRLTKELVEDLLAKGTCGLATYAESSAVHRPYLEALAARWSAAGREGACPVT